jgi:hypothetical protein
MLKTCSKVRLALEEAATSALKACSKLRLALEEAKIQYSTIQASLKESANLHWSGVLKKKKSIQCLAGESANLDWLERVLISKLHGILVPQRTHASTC